MLDPQEIEQWIAAGLPCEQLSVDGDGQHFQAVIVSREFAGLNRVQRQQRAVQADHRLQPLRLVQRHARGDRRTPPAASPRLRAR